MEFSAENIQQGNFGRKNPAEKSCIKNLQGISIQAPLGDLRNSCKNSWVTMGTKKKCKSRLTRLPDL
jgi:hypothetical protein